MYMSSQNGLSNSRSMNGLISITGDDIQCSTLEANTIETNALLVNTSVSFAPSVTGDIYATNMYASNLFNGTSTTSNNSNIALSSTNASFFPTFASATSGSSLPLLTDADLNYNPSTNTLSIVNLNLSGTFTGAGSSNPTITPVSTNALFYPTFVSATSGALPLGADLGLTYNPSTNTLSVGTDLIVGSKLTTQTNIYTFLNALNTIAGTTQVLPTGILVDGVTNTITSLKIGEVSIKPNCPQSSLIKYCPISLTNSGTFSNLTLSATMTSSIVTTITSYSITINKNGSAFGGAITVSIPTGDNVARTLSLSITNNALNLTTITYSSAKFNFDFIIEFTPDYNSSSSLTDLYEIYANITYTSIITKSNVNSTLTNNVSLLANTTESGTTQSFTKTSGTGAVSVSSTTAGTYFISASMVIDKTLSYGKIDNTVVNILNANSIICNEVIPNNINYTYTSLPTLTGSSLGGILQGVDIGTTAIAFNTLTTVNSLTTNLPQGVWLFSCSAFMNNSTAGTNSNQQILTMSLRINNVSIAENVITMCDNSTSKIRDGTLTINFPYASSTNVLFSAITLKILITNTAGSVTYNSGNSSFLRAMRIA